MRPIVPSNIGRRTGDGPRPVPLYRKWWIWPLVAVLGGSVLLSGSERSLDTEKISTPFPSPVYRIEAQSNGHQASVLNLGIGYPGAIQAPIPVDIDGDLLPDVTVAVNLLDTQGIHNPPRLGDIIRPNIEINRYPLDLTAGLLGRPSPPLKINVAFDIHDLEGEADTMTARFGYDTGPGGSIPPYFQATVDGLEDFFNPVTATISTKGAIITQSEQPFWYRGPLTVIGGFEQGDFNADLGLRYSPFPDKVTVTYARDDEGHHIDYKHDFPGEVDLRTTATIEDAGERTVVDALVQRLPKTIGVDFNSTEDGGEIRYDSSADGRLPDVDATFRGPLANDVFAAHLAIEGLPAFMAADWSIPEGGPVQAAFDSSGQGIGAIEVAIANNDGDPAGLPPLVPDEQQFLAVQHNTDTGGIRFGGRVERIRHLDIAQDADGGMTGTINVGDGELPLQVLAFLDLRSTGAPLIDASATLSPLPSGPQPGQPTFRLTPAGENQQAEPLTVGYSSTESVDVDADVLVRDAGAPPTPADPTDRDTCGDELTLCGELRIRHIPTFVEARISEFLNVDGKREARIDVDSGGPGHIDVFADVTIGPGFVGDPALIGERPLVTHAEMLGLPKHVRIRSIEGADETLERAEFHTCAYDYDAETCPAGSVDERMGALEFALSNFVPKDRNNTDVNVPSAYAATPNFATITARGHDNGNSVAFEATGRVQDIREFTYVSERAFGFRTDIGGNQPLSALVDVENIRLLDSTGVHRPNIYDVSGDVLIDPLPRQMTFCFNESSQEIVAPTSEITAEFQQANPFDPDGDPLSRAPLSMAYDGQDGNGGPQEFDVTASARLTDRGTTPVDAADDRRVTGDILVENVPASIRAHFIDPKDQGGGPTRLLIDAPAIDDQLRVEAAASLLDADLQCQDPRVPATTEQSAVCASLAIENVPTKVFLDYDPEVSSDNFVLDTEGAEQMDITDVVVSSVTRDESVVPARGKVLIAEGQILDIPKRVAGTLLTPAPDKPNDPILVDMEATPPLGSIDVAVRNFIAPDPIPDMAPQRAGLPAPDDWVSFIQRGDAFKGEVHISSVKRVGFKNQVDENGNKLDTSVVNVDFGKDKVVRGYVDLDPDGANQTLADVTLTDVPAGIEVCFRGGKKTENLDKLAAPGTATFCDQNPRHPDDNSDPETNAGSPETKAIQAKKGAFEVRMSPVDGPKELDVDAFVRSAKGGGTEVLAGRVDIDNIPNVIRGSFGDGTVDVGGFELDGTPDGIDQIAAHLASFDINDDGWTDSTRPYAPRFVERDPFGADPTENQHVVLRADDNDFEARARIGAIEGSGEVGSDLHRIQVSDRPCAKPQPVNYGNGLVPADIGARPDFPHLPTDDGTGYTCILGQFEPVGPSEVDPLDLSLIVDQGENRVEISQAQLDDIPEFFQVNVADADPIDTVNPDRRLRPHCVGAALPQPTNCVAPMFRLDTPGNSTLRGLVEYGIPGEVDQLASVQPRETLPNPADLTNSSGDVLWTENGVRARVGSFEDSTAIRLGFRFLIPASVTVDQVGTWSQADLSSKTNYRDASDLHVRYVAREKTGATFTSLGELSALIHSFDDGTQILLSDDDVTQGAEIPGELALDMYTRNHNGNGRNFLQVDGRSSAQDLDIRARMLGTGGSAIGRLDAQIRDIPPVPAAQLSSYSPNADPSFRLRAEILGDGKEPPDPAGSDQINEGEPPKEEECSFLLCVITQVRLKSVNVQFDFQPNDAVQQYARLLEAVIRTDGTKNGVEIRSSGNIDGSGTGPFLAGAQVSVDPLNVFVHAGIPLLGSADVVLISSLDAAFSMGGVFQGGFLDFLSTTLPTPYDPILRNLPFDPLTTPVPELVGGGATRVAIRQNLLNINLQHDGPGTSQIGPIALNVDVLHAEAWALFVKLIGLDWVPPHSSLSLPFISCQGGGILPGTLATSNEADAVAWPFFTPPVVYSGLLGGPATLFGALGGPFFCLLDTDMDLINDQDGNATGHPAVPVTNEWTGSVVPGAVVDASEPPPPVAGEDPPDFEDFTASASTPSLCGTFAFNNITIPFGVTLQVASSFNTLDINGDTDNPNDNIPAACPSGVDGLSTGDLQLIAAGNITVNGRITADALITSKSPTGATASTGNSGGSHGPSFPIVGPGGKGGNGGTPGGGTSGPTYGDFLKLNETEPGAAGSKHSAGGSGAAGNGGGVIRLIGDVLTVGGSGLIDADGANGQSVGNSGQCSVDDEDNPIANTGVPGGGGGTGGGILINVSDLRVQAGGAIHAHGGRGGNGSARAGGGGGGGSIKAQTALRSGALPVADGGSAGTNLCPDDFGNAGAGQNSTERIVVQPRSRIDISGIEDFGFWHSTKDAKSLVLPYSAAAATVDGINDFNVVLCGTRLPNNPSEDNSDVALSKILLPAQPTGVNYNNVCGDVDNNTHSPDVISGPVALATKYHQNTNRVNASNTSFQLDSLAEYYHGFYTVIWRSTVQDNDCFSFAGVGDILQDASTCNAVEPTPDASDLVSGIDNSDPNIRQFVVHTTEVRDSSGTLQDVEPVPTNTREIVLQWSADDNLSQIIGEECTASDPGLPYQSCERGQAVTLTSGDGAKTVGVRLIDAAGNSDTFTVDVILDTVAPDSAAAPLSSPDNSNGWYSSSPSFRLFGFNDHGGTGPGDPPFEYEFDGGSTKPCPGAGDPPECIINGSPGLELPGIGRHSLRFSAVDAVGNRDEGDDRGLIDVKIDGEAPTSGLNSVPAAPNGANGWFSGPTWITFGAFDQPGASGLTAAADDKPQGQIGGVHFWVTHDGVTTGEIIFDPLNPYRLEPGVSTVCWFAQDQAGNVEAPPDGATTCSTPNGQTGQQRIFKVDEADPTSALATSPSAPNGANGWFVSTPGLDPVVQDGGTAGSGVGTDTDPATLCGAKPLIAAVAPTGTCISIDGSPFVTTGHIPAAGDPANLWSLGEGLHEVRVFATDAAGRRSRIHTKLYHVDLSTPNAVPRLRPAQPAANGWYRSTPTVVLRANDGDRHGSQVDAIKYRIDGGPGIDYAGPFTLDEGIHVVDYWTTDEAGLVSRHETLSVAVDKTVPVAVAKTPKPALWLRSRLGLPLTSPTVELRWRVSEEQSGRSLDDDNPPNEVTPDPVRVFVTVYDVQGRPVRTLNAGEIIVEPGTVYEGSTTWDGKNRNLTGLVPLGLYYYRVTVVDAAGNVAMSGESSKLLIALSLL